MFAHKGLKAYIKAHNAREKKNWRSPAVKSRDALRAAYVADDADIAMARKLACIQFSHAPLLRFSDDSRDELLIDLDRRYRSKKRPKVSNLVGGPRARASVTSP